VAVGIATLSALYSLPPFNLKSRPLLGSAAHLAGGVLHFLLGYCVAGAIDRRGLVTAMFFGLTFAAGHLTQELRDYHADVLNTIRTNAVTFGQRPTFIASLVLFALAQTLLFALAVQGAVPRVLAAGLLLYPVQLRWSLRALAEGLTPQGIARLQKRYRVLHALIGVAMAAAVWLE
jgi:4-hydroxybenzoate polyprenyltransferase